MKNIQNRIADIKKRLKGVSGFNIVLVDEYKFETKEQAVKRYKKEGKYKETDLPDAFIFVLSDEQIQERLKKN